jgi:hypothetical protein
LDLFDKVSHLPEVEQEETMGPVANVWELPLWLVEMSPEDVVSVEAKALKTLVREASPAQRQSDKGIFAELELTRNKSEPGVPTIGLDLWDQKNKTTDYTRF